MNTADLLVEIGTEELPPRALRSLAEALGRALGEGLEGQALAFAGLTTYATPRRLAVLVEALSLRQPDREQVRRGPALAAAFDDEGCPTPAALGFARACGLAVEDLERLETPKGIWLAHRHREPGQPAASLLPDILRQALDRLPIPRRMRWGDGSDLFIRPVHWAVLLLGDQVVSMELMGVRTGRETRGHRFHHPEPIYVAEPAAYAPLLETEGHVLPDLAGRREAIRGQVVEAARRLGGEALIDEDLLEEVTALVEWPVAVTGGFEARFLELPPEVLISTMQDHQKYFPVVDTQGRLLPHFVTVANIESREPALVRAGNERVIRPRLSDAAFFWEQDRKTPLAARIDGLAQVVFQHRLGTLLDKAQRSAVIAAEINEALDGDPRLAERAALLAKCDLLTHMVYEFPELQGTMGRYYALHDGEPEEVAQAIEEHYRPRHAGDALPASLTGQSLGIADRLDTLVGIFAIGQVPTGDKDPFALRRAALGVLRILIEGALDLDLLELLRRVAARFGAEIDAEAAVMPVFEFILDRLRAYYLDAGIPVQVFEAVRARQPVRPLDFDRRIRAVDRFRTLPEAEALAAANKRIGNILRKAGEPLPSDWQPERLELPAERDLADTLRSVAVEVEPLLEGGDYTEALQRMARLRAPVDRFFDDVMVMVENESLRHNRLALLRDLQRLFLRVADLSRLPG